MRILNIQISIFNTFGNVSSSECDTIKELLKIWQKKSSILHFRFKHLIYPHFYQNLLLLLFPLLMVLETAVPYM